MIHWIGAFSGNWGNDDRFQTSTKKLHIACGVRIRRVTIGDAPTIITHNYIVVKYKKMHKKEQFSCENCPKPPNCLKIMRKPLLFSGFFRFSFLF